VENRTGVEPSDGAAGVAWPTGGELNVDPRAEGAQDLILAVFRLAVADYLGIAYSHDGGGPMRRMRGSPFLGEAAIFLASVWAACLADLVGLQASAIWREVKKRADESRHHHYSRGVIAA
jgi:hypothetical protein